MSKRFAGTLLLLISISIVTRSQVSDFISVQKKNGRVIRNYGVGSSISFISNNGYPTEGVILRIKNDTLLLRSMEVRQLGTSYGGLILDTTSFLSSWDYREISRVKIFRNRGWGYQTLSTLMMVGGAGYFFLNTVNSLYRKEELGERHNAVTLAGSAAVFGAGWLLRKKAPTNFTGKTSRVKYIKMR